VSVYTGIVDSGPYDRILSGLTPGVRLYVRVFARNAQGYSEGQAPTPPFEHPRALPRAPTWVRVAPTAASMLTVSWAPPTNDGGDAVTRYRVEWDTDAEFEGVLGLPHKGALEVDGTAHAALTLTDLAPGTRYFVRVAAGNRVGFGATTADGVDGAVPARQRPGRPGGVTVDADAAHPDVGCGRVIALTLAAPLVPAHGLPCAGTAAAPAACPLGMGTGVQADGGTRVTAYEVQWSTFADFRDTTSTGGTAVVAATGNGPFVARLSPATGQGLLAGQTYYLRAAARNAQGLGAYCAHDGQLCAGTPLAAVPSAEC
jgi:hypothetical protein